MEHAPMTKQRSKWHPIDSPMSGTRAFRRNVHDGTLVVMYAEEPDGWHLSISFRNHKGDPSRYPTWDEQVAACRHFLPAVPLCMYLPAEGDPYVAFHDSTFHWHEDPRTR